MDEGADRPQRYREAVAVWEALAPARRAACGAAERDAAAAAYRALGAAEAAAGAVQAALDAWKRAIELLDASAALAHANDDAGRDARVYRVAALHLGCADLLRARGDDAAAIDCYAAAIARWTELQRSASALYTAELADVVAHSSFAQATLQFAAGDVAAAAQAAARATAVWSAAAAEGGEPEPSRLDALANGYGFQGAALRRLGQRDAARQCFAQAAALWDGLQRALGAATPAGLLQRLALARQQIDQLDAAP